MRALGLALFKITVTVYTKVLFFPPHFLNICSIMFVVTVECFFPFISALILSQFLCVSNQYSPIFHVLIFPI